MVNILQQMTPAMLGYFKGLIYRIMRTGCVCPAGLSDLAHDQLYRLLYADFPYSRRLWEWFAVKLIGERGYLVMDERDVAEMNEKLGSGDVCLGFFGRESRLRNERRAADPDGREKKSAARIESLVKGR